MCFSSIASFSAAAVLGTVGFISLKKVNHTSQYMFAAIPLLFAVQQAIEGALWLSFKHADYDWQGITTYAFLFIAQVLWTIWVPLSFLLVETDPFRKRWLSVVAALGFLTSCLLGTRLITYPVTANVSGHHIDYDIHSSQPFMIAYSILYTTSVILPCFLSGIKKMKVLGVLLSVSLVFSKIVYEEYLLSVWCFFAAIISIYVLSIVNDLRKEKVIGYHYKKATPIP